MTKQEIFDKVAVHLISQGCKSMLPDSPAVCAYRGPEGRTCAVGCLIPDEYYSKSMENRDVLHSTPVREALTAAEVLPPEERFLAEFQDDYPGSTLSLLRTLQRVHDDGFVSDWNHRFRDVAVQFNLTADVLGPTKEEAA